MDTPLPDGYSSNYADLNLLTDLTVKIRAQGKTYFNGGNVGIGITDPNFKLEVDGDISANKIYIKDISATDISAVNISNRYKF